MRIQVHGATRRAAREDGFTYVGLLIVVAIMAAGLAAIGELASTESKRVRETELLFAGNQIANAIVAYRASSPGAPQYPQKLEDMLADNRYPSIRRYLRRVYPDPMTGRPDWGLVRGPGGGIVGVYSQSTARPLKIGNFPPEYESFANATSYAEWRFIPAAGGATPAKPPTPGALAGKAGQAPAMGAAATPFGTSSGAPSTPFGTSSGAPSTPFGTSSGTPPTPFGTSPAPPSAAK